MNSMPLIRSASYTLAETQPQRAIEMAQEYYGSDSSGRRRWLFQSIYQIEAAEKEPLLKMVEDQR